MTITGGYWTRTMVTEYNEDGFIRELPQLITGRYDHGCSSYVDSQQNDVIIISNLVKSYMLNRFSW